jgi:hypothetical protein
MAILSSLGSWLKELGEILKTAILKLSLRGATCYAVIDNQYTCSTHTASIKVNPVEECKEKSLVLINTKLGYYDS